MGFVNVVAPPREECKCAKPDSKRGKYFGPGTIWRCDNCGLAYVFVKNTSWSDQQENETYWNDEWERSPANDGVDNRPIAQVATVNSKLNLCGHSGNCRCIR